MYKYLQNPNFTLEAVSLSPWVPRTFFFLVSERISNFQIVFVSLLVSQLVATKKGKTPGTQDSWLYKSIVEVDSVKGLQFPVQFSSPPILMTLLSGAVPCVTSTRVVINGVLCSRNVPGTTTKKNGCNIPTAEGLKSSSTAFSFGYLGRNVTRGWFLRGASYGYKTSPLCMPLRKSSGRYFPFMRKPNMKEVHTLDKDRYLQGKSFIKEDSACESLGGF